MTTISELFQLPNLRTYDEHKELASNSSIGVEIEVENCVLPDNHLKSLLKYFEVEEDGSLRNHGKELKFKIPLTGKHVVNSLRAAEKVCTDVGAVCNNRTGLHVHINARDMTIPQLLNYIILYVIFEEVLFEYCGKDRETNIYCSSVSSCEGSLEYLSYLTDVRQARERLPLMGPNNAKYSSVNIQNLSRLGTIEFRGHRGTFIANEIINWINLLLSMKSYAMEFAENPQELILKVSELGSYGFLAEVFEEYSPLLEGLAAMDSILNGARLAQDILYYKELYNINKNIKQLIAKKGKEFGKDLLLEALQKNAVDKRLIDYYKGHV